jgi:acyl carrier protein
MNELLYNLKIKIIETLNLEDYTPEDIREDEALVGGDIGIDSVDILELVMMIEKDYGIRIDNQEIGKEVFTSLNSLASFIYSNSPRLQN